MKIDREWIVNRLRTSAAAVGMEWPPQSGQPVPLDRFMENLGVIHRELPELNRREVARDLLACGIDPEGLQRTDVPLSGFLFAQPGQAFAYVNRSDRLTRRRFSAAHELGHFVLHFQGLIGPEAEFIKADDREQFVESEEATGLILDRMEREANQFAAELLMPEAVVRERVAELGAKYRLNETFLRNQLSTELLVSREAIRWRLRHLQLIPDLPGEA